MLPSEAAWIGKTLRALPDDAYPLLNIGSSTREFRRVTQPWIDDLVFAPLGALGRSVIHVDLKPQDGVDVVADLSQDDEVHRLRELTYRSVLCSNLLEHLPSPAVGIDALLKLTRSGDKLVVTGPSRFPLHPDPIDNGYRPGADELAAAFGAAVRVDDSAIMRDRRMIHFFADASPRSYLGVASGLMRPWRKSSWRQLVSWNWRRAEAVGLLMERLAGDKDGAHG
jgi:hypothetical protein